MMILLPIPKYYPLPTPLILFLAYLFVFRSRIICWSTVVTARLLVKKNLYTEHGFPHPTAARVRSIEILYGCCRWIFRFFFEWRSFKTVHRKGMSLLFSQLSVNLYTGSQEILIKHCLHFLAVCRLLYQTSVSSRVKKKHLKVTRKNTCSEISTVHFFFFFFFLVGIKCCNNRQ